jgi:hypothetical protein
MNVQRKFLYFLAANYLIGVTLIAYGAARVERKATPESGEAALFLLKASTNKPGAGIEKTWANNIHKTLRRLFKRLNQSNRVWRLNK